MKLYVLKSIRTNNFNDDNLMEKINAMWEVSSRELGNYQNTIYGLYYDYESDYKGDYSLCVAIEEGAGTSLIDIPENINYEIFKVDTMGEQGVVKSWGKIWELEEAGELERTYTYDFEKYYPNGEIEIHVALK